MITIYTSIIKANKEFVARQNAIQQWYEFLEKINILMQDYTIDYEEYYNRQMVWCIRTDNIWDEFKWNIWTSGYCTNFTAYWNENSNKDIRSSLLTWYHDIYKCSSSEGSPKDIKWFPPIRPIKQQECGDKKGKQSYGQYVALFTDIKKVIDEWDDEDLWDMVVKHEIPAIRDKDNIQELYLISNDWKRRLFFRRKLFTWNDEQSQYKIQILRLRWFDAWQKHNFDEQDNEWLYDWQIDTWVCDTSMWFVWQWASISWAYSNYHLPKDVDDCWVDFTYWNTNIYAWNLSISPVGDPDLFWAKKEKQINPYLKIFIINWIYLPEISKESAGSSILEFKIPLETTINMKNFYKE